MSKFLIIFLIIILQSCSKPKTVLICGDHVCVNQSEAKQYFEENLTLEVKIIDKSNNNNVDLVELNLKEESSRKQVEIVKKKKTEKILKDLSTKEIKEIKRNIAKKNKIKKLDKKDDLVKKGNLSVTSSQDNSGKDKITSKKIINIQKEKVIDVCTILDKCSIEEISKYLIKLGKKRNFPDITIRE